MFGLFLHTKDTNTYPALFGQHRVHVLVRDGAHVTDVRVVALHPLPVGGNVFGIEQFGAGRVFAWISVEKRTVSKFFKNILKYIFLNNYLVDGLRCCTSP